MASTLKIILAVSGIFVAGAITGGFVSLRLAERIAREKRSQQRLGVSEMGVRLAEQLKLSPEQNEKISPVVVRTADELRRVRTESFDRMADLVAKMDAELVKILSADQRARLVEIRAREEERRQKWQAERSKRNEQRPPDGPGDERLPPPRVP